MSVTFGEKLSSMWETEERREGHDFHDLRGQMLSSVSSEDVTDITE